MKLTDDRRRAMFARMNGASSRKSGWAERAVKKFGTTEDFRKARWILPDGRMLDFYNRDGRREHCLLGLVDFDKKELLAMPPEDRAKHGIRNYVQRGAVRFDLHDVFGKWQPELYVAHSAKGMTSDQKRRVKEAIRSHAPGSVILEELDSNGNWSGHSTVINNPDSSISLRGVGRLIMVDDPVRVETEKRLESSRQRYENLIVDVVKKYPPVTGGGCGVASEYLLSKCPVLKKEWAMIQGVSYRTPLGHCFLVTPEGLIIDTQVDQFGALLKLPKNHKGYKDSYIYTREKHEEMLPRAKR